MVFLPKQVGTLALALTLGLGAGACTPRPAVTPPPEPAPPDGQNVRDPAPSDDTDPNPDEPNPVEDPDPSADESPPQAAGKACVVELHGKGGTGAGTSVSGDLTFVHPTGNASGWGGRQWLYFPESGYEQVRQTVGAAIDQAGCGRVIVHGFSNGAAAAAKLFCRGERFDNRVVGYIVDDPVPDHGVIGCKPASGARIRLYWTGGLSTATDGWSCAEQDWTCEGGSTIGIKRYASALGAEAKQSENTQHAIYSSPPEYQGWL